MLISSRKMLGFTITELMVAVTINMLLFGALLTVYLANLNHYRRSLNTIRLNQQLQAVMSIMTNDIKRAGYWGNAKSDVGTDTNTNPFQVTATDITVNGSCILFTYDHDADGALPAVSAGIDDERYGFRLINQAVQARPPGAAFSCTASNTAWENLTDPNLIQITALTFTLNNSSMSVGSGTRALLMRSVDITLTGRLTSDNTITKTITQHVRIRNDKFIP